MACRFQTEIIKLLAFLILMFLLVGCHSPVKAPESLHYDTSKLKSGDIILRKGFGLISEIVVIKLKDTLDISHCGIIHIDNTGKINVIHSLSKKVSDFDGVQTCTLKYFMEDSKTESVRILRFRNDSNSIIIKKALYYLRHQTPFDEKFDEKDTTAFFCSEFPIHIIKSGFNIDISNGASIPKFSLFLNKDYFDEIEFVVR
ncbi:MAG: YiiX/YebB-like N1pC/P60 family cysteine hydrolase [Paludibacter sp.]|nr:YiiX/YebB-like N1pC/P60 family cysteine hydrolase [Paludibacter sp.]